MTYNVSCGTLNHDMSYRVILLMFSGFYVMANCLV